MREDCPRAQLGVTAGKGACWSRRTRKRRDCSEASAPLEEGAPQSVAADALGAETALLPTVPVAEGYAGLYDDLWKNLRILCACCDLFPLLFTVNPDPVRPEPCGDLLAVNVERDHLRCQHRHVAVHAIAYQRASRETSEMPATKSVGGRREKAQATRPACTSPRSQRHSTDESFEQRRNIVGGE